MLQAHVLDGNNCALAGDDAVENLKGLEHGNQNGIATLDGLDFRDHIVAVDIVQQDVIHGLTVIHRVKGLVAVVVLAGNGNLTSRCIEVQHTAVLRGNAVHGLAACRHGPCACLHTGYIDLKGGMTGACRNGKANSAADTVVAVHVEHRHMIEQLCAHDTIALDQGSRHHLGAAVGVADVHDVEHIVRLIGVGGSGGDLQTTPTGLIRHVIRHGACIGMVLTIVPEFLVLTAEALDLIDGICSIGSTHIQDLIHQLAVVAFFGVFNDNGITVNHRSGLGMEQEALGRAGLCCLDLIKYNERTGILCIAVQLQVQEQHTTDSFQGIVIVCSGNIACDVGVIRSINVGTEFLTYDLGAQIFAVGVRVEQIPNRYPILDLNASGIGNGGNGQGVVRNGQTIIIRIMVLAHYNIVAGVTGQQTLVVDLEVAGILMLVTANVSLGHLHGNYDVIGGLAPFPAGTGDHAAVGRGQISAPRQIANLCIAGGIIQNAGIVQNQGHNRREDLRCTTGLHSGIFPQQLLIQKRISVEVGRTENNCFQAIKPGIILGLGHLIIVALGHDLTVSTAGVDPLIDDLGCLIDEHPDSVGLAVTVQVVLAAGHLVDQPLTPQIRIKAVGAVGTALVIGQGLIPNITGIDEQLKVHTGNVIVDGRIIIRHCDGKSQPALLDLILRVVAVIGQAQDRCGREARFDHGCLDL